MTTDYADTDEFVSLLRAYPHQWGSGQVHQIDHDQTLCGKSLRHCPGEKFNDTIDLITCKSCLKSRESRAKAAEWERNYAQQQARYAELRETDYEKQQRLWREAYNRYLLSGEWFAKRAKVMRRANDTCEGCGIHRAVQVHHLRYPRNCQPGSDEWVKQEKLFDLRAICRECHDDVHRR